METKILSINPLNRNHKVQFKLKQKDYIKWEI